MSTEKVMVLNGSKGIRLFGLKKGRIRLNPGTNLISKKEADALLESYPNQLAAYKISVVASVKKAGEPKLGDIDITKVNVKEATKSIEATNDLDALDKWKVQEEANDKPRKTVLTAIDNQVELVNIDLESEEETG